MYAEEMNEWKLIMMKRTRRYLEGKLAMGMFTLKKQTLSKSYI